MTARRCCFSLSEMEYNSDMDLKEKRLKLTARRIEALNSLGIHDTDALFSYYPYRYEIMEDKPFEQWQIKDRVTFEAEVVSAVRTWRHGRLTTSSFDVMAYERVLRITIFNRPWAKNLALNQIITIQGVYQGNSKVTAMTYDTKRLAEHDAVTPVYSVKEGIQQRTVRDSIHKVYEELQNEIRDIIPESLHIRYRLLRRADALRRIHFPRDRRDIQLAYRTLKYEEFLIFFTTIALMKNEEGQGVFKQPRIIDREKVSDVIAHLPYALTKDQETALNDILDDMSESRLMYRLVQGDVGCGKTAVAALAMYGAVTAGYQAALLAPTEILARQHLASLEAVLGSYDVNTAVLYSGMSTAEKRQVLQDLKDGRIDIIAGTHSLIQEGVEFHKLGLVVADEQQRFGVEQRRRLKEKGDRVDFLLMSATPIPRTLASAFYGDMDISTIETMPPGRQAPITEYIHENSFRSVLDDVSALLADGHQLYVICAAVEESEDYDARNVVDMCRNIQKLYPQYHVGLLHGRMSSEEKQAVMNRFAANEIQILVSTTVVEVGMNVVNATGMIIYDADRFGLSQLHQLRGRIQRGSDQGRCWLLSSSQEEKTQQRLNVLASTNNGFEIAYEDLRLRGPGDILGTRQSGIPDFILGNLIEDTDIIQQARKDAEMITADPDNEEWWMLLDHIRMRNRTNAVYAD